MKLKNTTLDEIQIRIRKKMTNNFTHYFFVEHHGVKGMHWGVRRYQNPDGTLTELGKKRSLKEKAGDLYSRAMGVTPKLQTAYLNAQTKGVKPGKHGNEFSFDKSNAMTYKEQRAAAQKARRYVADYIEKYGKQPINYAQSINAQKGAAIGTAIGIAVPIVLPLWATIPAGYYIGGHMKTKKK